MENGATGIVELSRTRNLRNTAIIRGERGTLEVHLHTNQVRFHPHNAAFEVVGNVLPDSQGAQPEQSLVDLLSAQLTDWVDAIHNGSSPSVSGVEGRRSVALIEACYEQRKPLVLPWVAPDVTEASVMVGEAGR
jgi:predicted dehydrogenase